MPRQALRVCAHVGCTNLVTSGYCEEHKAEVQFRRDRERQRLYNSARWRKIRKNQLAKEPWCADHLARGEYVPATEVDHQVPHKGNKNTFFLGPFNSFCKICHSKKTHQETRGVGGVKSLEGRGDGAQVSEDFSLYGIGLTKK